MKHKGKRKLACPDRPGSFNAIPPDDPALAMFPFVSIHTTPMVSYNNNL